MSGQSTIPMMAERYNITIQILIDYTYDGLSRLLSADYDNGTTVYNYCYDEAGNLVNMNGTTRTYNTANQMVNDGTNSLTYDNNVEVICEAKS